MNEERMIEISTDTEKDDDVCYQMLFFPKEESKSQKRKAFAMLMMASEMLEKLEVDAVFKLCIESQKDQFPEEAQCVFFKALRYLKKRIDREKLHERN